jgi:NADH-quinone oxidoreductase subunit L
MFLTFWGRPRWAGSEHIQHAVHHGDAHGDHADPVAEHSGDSHQTPAAAHPVEGTAGYHPHESPMSMLVPLGLLSLGAIFAGFFYHDAFIDTAGEAFWRGSLVFSAEFAEAVHHVPLWVKLASSEVMLIGLLVAWYAYIRDPGLPARFTAMFRGLHAFLFNKWYFDELYDALIVRPALWLGRVLWKGGDEGTIDRFGPNGLSALVAGGSVLARRLQTGYLYTYALVMLIGLAAAAAWFLPRVMGGE